MASVSFLLNKTLGESCSEMLRIGVLVIDPRAVDEVVLRNRVHPIWLLGNGVKCACSAGRARLRRAIPHNVGGVRGTFGTAPGFAA